jgi:predicted nicotinamide N-methyase
MLFLLQGITVTGDGEEGEAAASSVKPPRTLRAARARLQQIILDSREDYGEGALKAWDVRQQQAQAQNDGTIGAATDQATTGGDSKQLLLAMLRRGSWLIRPADADDDTATTEKTLSVGGHPATITTLSSFLTHKNASLDMVRGTGFDTTGAQVWMSALVLQAFLVGTAEGGRVVTGRRCIELGAGTGVASIAAARLGARFVAATDGNPVMVALSELNAIRNLDGQNELPRFVAAQHLWGSPPPKLWSAAPGSPDTGSDGDTLFDTIMLTDLLYSHSRALLLLDSVAALCRQACEVLVAYEQQPSSANAATGGDDHHDISTTTGGDASAGGGGGGGASNNNGAATAAAAATRPGLDGAKHSVHAFFRGLERANFTVSHLSYAQLAGLRAVSVISPAHQPEPIQRLDDSAAAACCRLQTRRTSRHLSTF